MARPAIATDSLTRDYGAVRALDHLTVEVPAGDIFGLLGPNGAGKTTVVRLLLGLVEPTEGSGQVLGFDIRRHGDEIRNRCGALLDHSGIYERLSALDNMEYYGRIWRMPDVSRRMRIEVLLKHFGLWERRFEIAGTWGRGMLQKLAVARTLLHQPALAFLDEPTAGLDPLAANALRKELADLSRSEGMTIFLTTHNLAEAEQLCDRMAVIRSGKLVACGTGDEIERIKGAPRLEIIGRGFSDDVVSLLRVRPEINSAERIDGNLVVDLHGNVDTAPLVSLLVESGVEIEEVLRHTTSLESALLSLMADGDEH